VRGRYWFKVKPAETLDLVIVGAEWGHGRRSGWLSDYYLAALDPSTGEFLVVGKTFKGLTDAEFEEMTRKLLELKVRDEGWRVWVKPAIVAEVAFSEVQRSPKYRSGFALRFARIVRLRPDKSPWEAATIEEVKRIYEEQFRTKAKASD
jgi:DNA ligase-1